MRTRKMSDATRKKISDKLRGRRKSDTHRARISTGMKRMWAQIPYEDDSITDENNTDMK